MNVCLAVVVLSLAALVSASKDSCVCDCDGEHSSAATISKRPPTKSPVPTTTADPTSGPCRCLKDHKTIHYFCGSRRDQLAGECRNHHLYTCGPKKMKAKNSAPLYKRCQSCIEMIGEPLHGQDHCRNDIQISGNSATE